MHRFLTVSLAMGISLHCAARLVAQSPRSGTAAARRGASGGDPAGRPAPRPGEKTAPNTSVVAELVTGSAGNGLKAREWAEALSKLDVIVTVRSGRSDDKLGISERKSGGSLRVVTIVGAIDSRGRLIFPDQVFTETDSDKLATWISELRTYGAQGDPHGRPVWGLTKEQFGVIYAALKRPLASEPRELELKKAVALIELPKAYSLRYSPEAARLIQSRGENSTVNQSLSGLSQGTALAAMLAGQGLGFRPRRLPDGEIELTVIPLEEKAEVWPVGWPREQGLPETAPALLEFKTIDLADEPLSDILEAVATVIKFPILIDQAGLAAKDIDLSQVLITHPRKRTTWTQALTAFTFKARAKFEVLVDEAGKPFLWVTPLSTPPRSKE
jgi:hypothetical protein